MANRFTGPESIQYLSPRPFALPIEEIREDVRFVAPTDDVVQRQFIKYAGVVLEEIMLEITVEYGFRGLASPVWTLYFGGGATQSFTPSTVATSIITMPIEFFPILIRDIQDAIEFLLNDTAGVGLFLHGQDAGAAFSR